MFWGLIMEPKRRYTQVVKRPFHISMAALDIFSADENPTQLMLYFEERNYLLCTLQKGHTVQCTLDLNFEVGEEVVFATNGNCNIHLSGFLQEDQLDNLEDLEEEEEEEIEENEQDVKVSRKKKSNFLDSEKPSSKKSKLESLLKEDFDSNDEDDESFVVSGGADDDDIEEEEDDDEEYEDEEEDDESDDDEEENTTKSNVQAKNEKKSNVQAINGEKAKPLRNQIKDKKKNEKSKKDTSPVKQNDQKNASPQQKRTLEGGVVVQDLRIGEGAIAKSGKVVQVYYEGRLKQNNKLFDQSTKGSGFKFRLGKQEVIKGWDVGVVGMKVGGRRRITCPPPMAYGQKGSPPAIPPNAALVFEVELKNVI